MVAKYKYDPYGRTITSTGPLSTANLYRFSSKEIHPNSGLYYFGYRSKRPLPAPRFQGPIASPLPPVRTPAGLGKLM
jgi:hypothetical protein